MKRSLLKLAFAIYIRVVGIFQPISLGVRVMLIREGKVLLVKQSYHDDWFFPGGGVKRGESIEEAVRREAMEECGATLGELTLLGIYSHNVFLATDHIAYYLCTDFTYTGKHDFEIEAVKFFPLNALPDTLHSKNRERLDEYLSGDSFTRR